MGGLEPRYIKVTRYGVDGAGVVGHLPDPRISISAARGGLILSKDAKFVEISELAEIRGL